MRLALAHVLAPGHRIISRLISSCGREQRDWPADSKLFNRSPWKPEKLFAPALGASLMRAQEESFIHVAGDMTHVRKTGKGFWRSLHVRSDVTPLSRKPHLRPADFATNLRASVILKKRRGLCSFCAGVYRRGEGSPLDFNAPRQGDQPFAVRPGKPGGGGFHPGGSSVVEVEMFVRVAGRLIMISRNNRAVESPDQALAWLRPGAAAHAIAEEDELPNPLRLCVANDSVERLEIGVRNRRECR